MVLRRACVPGGHFPRWRVRRWVTRRGTTLQCVVGRQHYQMSLWVLPPTPSAPSGSALPWRITGYTLRLLEI